MTKRKINIIFGLTLVIFIVGFVISNFLFPDFIGDNERDLLEIVPNRFWLIFSIPVFIIFLYLQIKYKLFFSGFVINFLPFKIIASFILLSFISALVSFLILFNIFSYTNYCFSNKTEELKGSVYKMNIYIGKRGADKYYIYFNDTLKFKTIVSLEKYNNYNIGDMINFKVLKGRFYGYYVIREIHFIK